MEFSEDIYINDIMLSNEFMNFDNGKEFNGRMYHLILDKTHTGNIYIKRTVTSIQKNDIEKINEITSNWLIPQSKKYKSYEFETCVILPISIQGTGRLVTGIHISILICRIFCISKGRKHSP